MAAGAAIIVKRYLGSAPSDTSPALTKAMLIAGARSVRGGLDRRPAPLGGGTVAGAPNAVQGFGRISLDPIITGSTPPVTFDQAASRHFTSSGQTWTTRLTVRDSTKPVVVALVWSDAPGMTYLGNPLVNNLDLVIRPQRATCTYFQGNVLSNDESVSYPCAQSATPDAVNNVEYSRFFVTDFTNFDVTVSAAAISAQGDPAFSGQNQDFALVVLNANLAESSSVVPPQLTAQTDAATSSTVHLTWTAPRNMIVHHYEVNRGATVPSIGLINSTPTFTTTSYDDTGLPSGIYAYVYNVKAVGPTTPSTSNNDVAATVAFTDTTDALNVVRAVHFTKLLDAVNAIRTAAGLGAISFTAPAPNAPPPTARVAKQHVLDLRTGLAQARSAVGAPAVSYAETSAQMSKVKGQHVQELRNGVK